MSLPKIQQSDLGYYALRFLDGGGGVILPDLDPSLKWEFRDSGSTLRFTATLLSTPPIIQDIDGIGDFFKVSGMDLTNYTIGIVQVSAFANVGGSPIQPDPLLALAFEVVEDIVGYCSRNDVKNYSGIQYEELDLSDENELDTVLNSWIAEATDYIDFYTKDTFLVNTPKGIEMICMRIVSNMAQLAMQRRKTPLIQIGDFNVTILEDKIITKEMKEALDLYLKKTDATDARNIFAGAVVLPVDE